jgi:hypothetical protein
VIEPCFDRRMSPAATESSFLRAAIDVGAELCAAWRENPEDGLRRNPSIYDGSCGRILACLELYRATGESVFAEVATRDLRRTAGLVRHGVAGTGFMHGNAGLALTYHRASQVLQEDKFAGMATQAIKTPSGSGSFAVDYYAGFCGTVVVAAMLYDETGDDQFREVALRNGELLFTKGVESRPEGLCLKTSSLRLIPGIGLAHGASGLALAAIELWRLTGIGEFEYFARSAIEYEDSFFTASDANWVETRLTRNSLPRNRADAEQLGTETARQSLARLTPAHPTSLCNGRSGLLSVRLRLLELIGWCGAWTPQLEANERHWASLRSPAGDYTYCCGYGGVADALLTAARVLGQPRYLHLARMVGRSSIEQGRQKDWLSLWQKSPGRSHFGFMKGLSGITYMYLRLANPTRFQSLVMPTLRTDGGAHSRSTNGTVEGWAHRARLRLLGKYWHYTASAISASGTLPASDTVLEEAVRQSSAVSVGDDISCVGRSLRMRIATCSRGAHRSQAIRAWQIESHRYRFDRRNPVLGLRDYVQSLLASSARPIRDSSRFSLQQDVRIWSQQGGMPTIAMYVRRSSSRFVELSDPAASILRALRAGGVSLSHIRQAVSIRKEEGEALVRALLHANIVTLDDEE